jgi:hypothetical protein
MTEDDPAETYRLKQAEKILSLFESANGHPARSIDELMGGVTGRKTGSSATPRA